METLELVMCGLLIFFALFLIIAVLLQHGKDHRLSGTIAGGAENFFGKTKGRKIDAVLNKLTTVVAIVFVVVVLVVYVLQPDVVYSASAAELAPGALSEYYDSSIVYAEDTTAAATEAVDTPESTADTSAQ